MCVSRVVIFAAAILACSITSCSLEAPCDPGAGYHYRTDGVCVENSDAECGPSRLNCVEPDANRFPGMKAGECGQTGTTWTCLATECDEANSWYPDDTQTRCVQKCECDFGPYDESKSCSDEKIAACVSILCPATNDVSRDVYCIRDEAEMTGLRDWIEAKRPAGDGESGSFSLVRRLPVYLINDLLLDAGVAGSDLTGVSLTTFGNRTKTIRVSGTGKRGLFGKVHNATISNVVLNMTVEGPDAHGALADVIEESTLNNVKVLGSVNHTADSDNNGELTCSGAGAGVGIGGMAGSVFDSTLTNIQIGSADEPFVVNGNASSAVGGLAGLFCDSSVLEAVPGDNSDGYANYYHVASVSGNGNVGGVFGLVELNADGEISGMSGIADVVTGTTSVGGFAGIVFSDSPVHHIEHSSLSVNAPGEFVGGFIGQSLTDLDEIDSGCDIVFGQNSVGGMVGRETGFITSSRNNAVSVSGQNYVGGMVGELIGAMRSARNTVSDAVRGAHYVGGMVGSMAIGSLTSSTGEGSDRLWDNDVKFVDGQRFVGGLAGYLGTVTVDGMYSRTGKVRGWYSVGGFAGRLWDGVISNARNDVTTVTDEGFEVDESIANKDAIGGFAGMIMKNGRIEHTKNDIGTLQTNANFYVGGFAGIQQGVISSIDNTIGSLEANNSYNNYANHNYNYYTVAGGVIGHLQKDAIAQNINNRGTLITATSHVGGAFGWIDGYVTYLNNAVDTVIARRASAGGAAYSISSNGLVTDTNNYARLVLAPNFAGGFSSENDGETNRIRSFTEYVAGFVHLGGAFGGTGGRIGDFVNYAKNVIKTKCTDAPGTCDDESERYCTITIDEQEYPFCIDGSMQEWNKNGAGITTIGGFAGIGDGMFNAEFSAIINRVGIVSGEAVGGFMGSCEYKTFTHRHFIFENISSWSSIVGDPLTSGLFIGMARSESSPEAQTSNRLSGRNIVMSGHTYDADHKEYFNNNITGPGGIHAALDQNNTFVDRAYTHCLTNSCKYDINVITEAFSPITGDNYHVILDKNHLNDRNGMRPKVEWHLYMESDEEERIDFPDHKNYEINDIVDLHLPVLSFTVE